jgi:hypothetical protein
MLSMRCGDHVALDVDAEVFDQYLITICPITTKELSVVDWTDCVETICTHW